MVLCRSLWPIHSCTRRMLVRAIIVVEGVTQVIEPERRQPGDALCLGTSRTRPGRAGAGRRTHDRWAARPRVAERALGAWHGPDCVQASKTYPGHAYTTRTRCDTRSACKTKSRRPDSNRGPL